jgi:hypothetical protein
MGHTSSSQSAIILKHPDIDSLIYIVTTPYSFDYLSGIRYSVYNLNLTKFTKKNVVLGNNSAERVAAVYHKNGKDIWIIWHKYGNNCFLSSLLTKNGFIDCKIESCIGTDYFNLFDGQFVNQGQIKISSNGKLLAQTILNAPNDGFEYFNFDNDHGKVNGPVIFNASYFPIAIEFSSNADYFVVSSRDSSLIAFDIKNKTKKTIFPIHSQNNRIPYIQQNSNNDIICAVRDSGKVGIIKKGKFSTVSYENNYHNLGNKKCNSGLPNFNQSYFYTPSIDFAYDYNCLKNSIDFEGRDTFYADTYEWVISKFAQPKEATYSTKKITHFFNDTGIYQVCYIATKGSRTDTIIKTIIIYPKIRKDFLGRDTVYETGTSISKILKAPLEMHCYFWQNDSSKSATFKTDTTGTFICRITNQSFCIVTDSIVISSCKNDLTIPSIFRSKDSLYTYQPQADSFVWYRNGLLYRITKVPFLALSDTGIYRVEAAKKGHCSRSSGLYIVNKLNMPAFSTIQGSIRVFPNPTSNILNLEFENPCGYIIKVYNSLGQIIYTIKAENNSSINLNGLAKGAYLIYLTNTLNQHFNTIILKE